MSYRRARWPKASARDSSGSTPSVSLSSGGTFDLDAKRDTLRQLEERMSAPGFWGDQQAAQAVVQQVKAAEELDRAVRRDQRSSAERERARRDARR